MNEFITMKSFVAGTYYHNYRVLLKQAYPYKILQILFEQTTMKS